MQKTRYVHSSGRALPSSAAAAYPSLSLHTAALGTGLPNNDVSINILS